LITLDPASPRTAGTGGTGETVAFAATSADVRSVIASGRRLELDPESTGQLLASSLEGV
jgi:hypothetical protein